MNEVRDMLRKIAGGERLVGWGIAGPRDDEAACSVYLVHLRAVRPASRPD